MAGFYLLYKVLGGSLVMLNLNENINILDNSPIINSKASEVYVSVIFTYGDIRWEGYVPIEYRRTGLSIKFEDKEKLYQYLNFVYVQMKPERVKNGKKSKKNFGILSQRQVQQKRFLIRLLKVGGNVEPAKCHEIQIPNEEFKI